MPQTPLGYIEYPNKDNQDWYDDLEDWLSTVERLGIPTYETFGDLPAAGSTSTITDGARDQKQLAAVTADKTIYRDNGSQWVTWMGEGTSSRPHENLYADSVSANAATITNTGTLAVSTETISNNKVPYSAPTIQLEPEGGSADDLDAIDAAPQDGSIVILRGSDTANITLVDDSGTQHDLRLAGDTNKTIGATDTVMLAYNEEFDIWAQVSIADN